MEFPKSRINEVQRGKKKASYNQKEIYDILDSTEICHIAFLIEGRAMVQPINFGRFEDKIYLHGSLRNRMTQAIIDNELVSLNVMILDAMKLTRSAYHHSVNYRSVNIFGRSLELHDPNEKLKGLAAIINHFVPNRWEHCRPPNEKELLATRVVEIQIETASAKIAQGDSKDNKSDLSLPYWAGVLPVRQKIGTPIPAKDLDKDLATPQHILDFLNQKK
ncbi:MAG: pyridoxamine 5'-phosphate oxidase family protein [Flavobacteriaceae bacterium]|nr:pyridoxamine 5'-phosphate oxidase family protein [Flavobacteriaceae bacterium]